VHAFEPLPNSQYYFTRSILALKNITKRKNAHVYPVGCGNDYSVHRIYVAQGNAGHAMLDTKDTAVDESASINVTIVPCQDALWPLRAQGQKKPHIALLKMDVEGFEDIAASGLVELFNARAVQSIRVEIAAHLLKQHGTSSGAFCKKLRSYGFTQLFYLDNFAVLTDETCQSFDTKGEFLIDVSGFLSDFKWPSRSRSL